jgi:hypothetical protein
MSAPRSNAQEAADATHGSQDSVHSGESFVEPQQGIDINDTEQATFAVKAQEDVFSYLMMIGPTEGIKGKRSLTADVCMAYVLVALVLFAQGLVLYAVFDRVVQAKADWEFGIVDTGQGDGWNLIGEAPKGCNTGESLCIKEKGMYSCAPPIVKLTGRWDELDTNGDGVWTRKEAEAAQEELQCKYVVDPVEVFDVFITFIKEREKIIWVHPDVRDGTAIPKAYFTYAVGDIIMCGYRNEKMCANLLQRGFFDAPLTHHGVPRVGNTINSALDYCYDLLRPGGTCEITLPSTYSVWKMASDQECQKKSYDKFVYTHPVSGDFKSLLNVQYEAVDQYIKTSKPLFIVYKTVIIGLWVMAMVYELKMMIIVFTWIARFPGPIDGIPLAEEEEDGGFKINGTTTTHRAIVLLMSGIRLAMLGVLTLVGLDLLLNSPEYMSLIFDALAMVFVLELGNMLYGWVLRQKVRENAENTKPMMVNMYGNDWLNKRPGLLDLLWLVISIAGAIYVMYSHYHDTVGPLRASLECACLTEGQQCTEAHQFDFYFWYDYWQVKTPELFKDVAAMKKEWEEEEWEQEGAAAAFLQRNVSLLTEAAPRDVSFLRLHSRGRAGRGIPKF